MLLQASFTLTLWLGLHRQRRMKEENSTILLPTHRKGENDVFAAAVHFTNTFMRMVALVSLNSFWSRQGGPFHRGENRGFFLIKVKDLLNTTPLIKWQGRDLNPLPLLVLCSFHRYKYYYLNLQRPPSRSPEPPKVKVCSWTWQITLTILLGRNLNLSEHFPEGLPLCAEEKTDVSD